VNEVSPEVRARWKKDIDERHAERESFDMKRKRKILLNNLAGVFWGLCTLAAGYFYSIQDECLEGGRIIGRIIEGICLVTGPWSSVLIFVSLGAMSIHIAVGAIVSQMSKDA
jgi:hypothetical protein